MHRNLVLATGLLASLLASCSSSSSEGAISGMSAPSTMSVITTEEGPPSAAPGASTYPASSPYVLDGAELHIYDPSMESLDTVNMILCLTSMAAYDEMVNQGTYTAWIDESICDSGSQDDGSQGQATASDSDWALYTVNSRRLTRTSDQDIRFWVPNNNPPPGAGDTIYAHMNMTSGATPSLPFGQFSMSFAGPLTHGDLATDPKMHGALATTPASSGDIGFQFYEENGDVDVAHAPGDMSWERATTVEMNLAQTAGAARIYNAERYDHGGGDSGKIEGEWELVFDEDEVRRRFILNTVPGTPQTFSRDDFTDMVWRYNLYHAQGAQIGQRVELNSGFGFQASGGEFGWIGYHGLWVPDSVTINTGDTITRNDGSAYDGDTYTVLRSPGKLIKNTRQNMLLTDLAGQLFRWWNGGTEYLVDYDGVDFRQIGTWNSGTNSWDPFGPTTITVSAVGGYLNMWSESLGGPVSYVDGDASITYFETSFVDGNDSLLLTESGGHVELYGLVECLQAGMSAATVEAGTIYLADAPDTLLASSHYYQFDVSDLTLYHDPNKNKTVLNAVGLTAGQEPTTGPYMWGMRSGPLVTDLSGLTDVWDIWNVSEFYIYETGHNEWNQLVTIEDALSAPVSFDAPMQILYTHSTANDRNADATYDGQKYVLQYGGPGNLHGLPNEGIDLTGDSNPDRWYPQFSIADGVLMGPTDTEYVIKATEIERSLDEVADNPLLDLSDASGLTLPTSALYTTPDMSDTPVITDPPAVVNGEVVD